MITEEQLRAMPLFRQCVEEEVKNYYESFTQDYKIQEYMEVMKEYEPGLNDLWGDCKMGREPEEGELELMATVFAKMWQELASLKHLLPLGAKVTYCGVQIPKPTQEIATPDLREITCQACRKRWG